jgi:hypothetical protein
MNLAREKKGLATPVLGHQRGKKLAEKGDCTQVELYYGERESIGPELSSVRRCYVYFCTLMWLWCVCACMCVCEEERERGSERRRRERERRGVNILSRVSERERKK